MTKAERAINGIVAQLVELKAAKEALSREESALWDSFHGIADGLAGKGQPYRFLDGESGLVLARVLSERLDVAKLEERLSEIAWKAVTVAARRFERSLLDAAVIKGKVPAGIVENCVERSLRRYGPAPATKDERAGLAKEQEQQRER